MATAISYVLVSGPNEPEDVAQHALFTDHDFEQQESEGETASEGSWLKFMLTSSLEEKQDLEEGCKALSAEFSEATVTLCQLEERFDQVEHLRSVVYMEGRHAGEIEHGYVLNVGT